MEIIPGEHQTCYKHTIKINDFKRVFTSQEEIRSPYTEIFPGKNSIAFVMKKQPEDGRFLSLELLAGEAVDPPSLAGIVEISLGENSLQFRLGDQLDEKYLQFDANNRSLVLPGQFGWALATSGEEDALQIKFKLFTQSEQKTLPDSLKNCRYLSTQTMKIMKDESTSDLKISCGEKDNKKVFAVHKNFFCASRQLSRVPSHH